MASTNSDIENEVTSGNRGGSISPLQKEDSRQSPKLHRTKTTSINTTNIVSSDKFESLYQENKRLKTRLKHFENIGVMISGTTERNTVLERDNEELRRLLNIIKQQISNEHVDSTTPSTSDYNNENKNHSQPKSKSPDFEMIESVNSDKSCNNNMAVSEATAQTSQHHVSNSADVSLTHQNSENDDVVPLQRSRHESMLSSSRGSSISGRSKLHTSDSFDATVSMHPDMKAMQSVVESFRHHAQNTFLTNKTTDEVKSHHTTQYTNATQPPPSFQPELSDSSDEEFSGTQLSQQINKCMEILSRVIDRETRIKKKLKTSQAFCEALLCENDKLKQTNRDHEEICENKDKEIAKLKYEIDNIGSDNEHIQQRNGANYYQVDEEINHVTSEEITNVAKLKSRIKKLERQRAEVLGVNKQWDAKYKKDMERFNTNVIRLRDENKVLKSQLENGTNRGNVDMLLKEAKRQIDTLQREKKDLAHNFAMEHTRNKELKHKIDDLNKDIKNITAENKRLSQALEAAYGTGDNEHPKITVSLYDSVSPPTNPPITTCVGLVLSDNELSKNETESKQPLLQAQGTTSSAHDSTDAKTQLQLLEEQVKIYKEDFETERRDREKSQNDKTDLENKLKNMALEVQALNEQVRINEHDFRQERRDKVKLQQQMQRIQHQSSALGGPATLTARLPPSDSYYGGRDEYNTAPEYDSYSTRRYRMGQQPRTSAPPPYNDNPRSYPPRRIRNGFLERNSDIVYPPTTTENSRY